jgi:ABC-2 type transport system permease protein
VVRRIFRLWALYARMDVMWFFKDFKNFAVCTITDLIINLASVTGVWLLSERFAGIGSLGRPQILFMLGYSLTVSGIHNMFFNWNISHISRRIGRGQLDHVLIQPQPLWMSLLTEGFIPASGSIVLVTGAGFLTYASVQLGWIGNAAGILLLPAGLLLSTAVNLSYSFLWGCIAFYAPVAAEEVCTSIMDLFSGLRHFPLGGLGKIAQALLVSILPVGLCAWYPAVAFTTGRMLAGVGVMLAVTVILVTVTAILFGKGMEHYVQVGSYRYHDRGHRR